MWRRARPRHPARYHCRLSPHFGRGPFFTLIGNTFMNLQQPLLLPRAGRALAAGSLAALLAACSSVDLNERYAPTQVRMPGMGAAPAGAQPVGTPVGETPQSQPVQPSYTQTQELAPLDPAAAGQPGASHDSANYNADYSPPAQPAQPDMHPHLLTFSTPLTSAQAVPASHTNGQGQIDAVYDTQPRLLRWKASWSGLSGPITSVAFYGPAQPGQVAPKTIIWPGPFGPSYEGRATLTPQQARDLQNGSWYLSVTTPGWPAGEIRGQMQVVR